MSAATAPAIGVETPTSSALDAESVSVDALPEILTVDEAAQLLRLNRKTVYEALARGEIPGARRIGRSYRIARAALLAWLADGQARVSRSRRHP